LHGVHFLSVVRNCAVDVHLNLSFLVSRSSRVKETQRRLQNVSI